MRRLLALALMVPLVAGCGWFGGWAPYPGRSRHSATGRPVLRPDTAVVTKWKRIEERKCPSCVNSGSPMPPFAALGATRLRELAVFIESSKGTQ